MDDFGRILANAKAGAENALAEGVRECLDDLLSESRDEIPYDQGDLSNSGKVTVVRRGGMEVEGAVSFDTPYAVRQHEDTTLNHQDGRKAGYLRDPQRANADRYLDYIADQVGDGIR